MKIHCGSTNYPVEKDMIITMPEKFFNEKDVVLKIGIDNKRELLEWSRVFQQYGIPVEDHYNTG